MVSISQELSLINPNSSSYKFRDELDPGGELHREWREWRAAAPSCSTCTRARPQPGVASGHSTMHAHADQITTQPPRKCQRQQSQRRSHPRPPTESVAREGQVIAQGQMATLTPGPA